MKVMFLIIVVILVVGVILLYVFKVVVYLDCGRFYQECVDFGNLVGDCQFKEDECWVINYWFDGVKMFQLKVKLND